MKLKNILLVLPILIWVGCEDKKDDDVPGTDGPGYVEGSPSGGYQFTGVTMFESATCESEGITHMCTDNIDNQADCEAAGEEWLPLIDVFTGGDPASAPHLFFGADGLFINPDCDSFPFTVDGTTITMVEDHCNDDKGDDMDAPDEAACTAAGGSWEEHTITATINADGTMTLVDGDDGHCDNSIYETEEECVANLYEWEDPSCMQLELTYDETHDGTCVPDDSECSEHSDCDSNYCSSDGECIDCPYEYDCSGECGGGNQGYQCWDGSYECNEEDCPVNIFGTYTLSSVTVYEGEECSGSGISGMCFTDEAATTEADCPLGMCSDNVDGGEAECEAAGATWITGMCLDNDGNGIDDSDAQASSEGCAAAEGNWLIIGWNPLTTMFSAMMGNSVTFGADGVFTNPDGDTGTYTLVDNVLAITETECYDESIDDGNDDYTNEADCSGAGLEWSVFTNPGTLNEDGTITVEMHSEAECNDDSYETQAECEAGGAGWDEAECTSTMWTLSN